MLAAVTVDRFIAITFPLKMKQMCTPRRAHIVSTAILMIAIAKNLHLFWTRGVQEIINSDGVIEIFNCGWPNESYEYFGKYIRPWIAFSIYAFIPITGILFLNVIISYKLLILKQKVRPGNKIGTGSGDNSQSGDKKNVSQMTAMLLSVSIVFLILIIPSITVIVAKPHVIHTDQDAVRLAYVEVRILFSTI